MRISIKFLVSLISYTKFRPLARERNDLEASHNDVIIVMGRSVADWLWYIPDIIVSKNWWNDVGINASRTLIRASSVKGINLRRASKNIINGKNDSIIKKADCPENAGIAVFLISSENISARLYILRKDRINILCFIYFPFFQIKM